jgi:4-hydroxy-3-methylbut-2-en-1-yl diphosphate synthase IspG/GcpE
MRKPSKTIKTLTKVPLVADIHIDYRLALAALDSGVDAVRINPGQHRQRERDSSGRRFLQSPPRSRFGSA